MLKKISQIILLYFMGVAYLNCDTNINLNSKTYILFDPASSLLSDKDKEERKKIKKLAEQYHQNTSSKILLKGYASTDGAYKFNQQLSEKRAMSVQDILTKEEGVPSSSIESKAYGSVANNYSPAFSRIVEAEIIEQPSEGQGNSTSSTNSTSWPPSIIYDDEVAALRAQASITYKPPESQVTYASPTSSSIESTYHWNTWAEEYDNKIAENDFEPQYAPVKELKPGGDYAVTVDFSGIPYHHSGMQTKPSNQRLNELLKNMRNLTLQLVIIPDPRVFDTRPITIDDFKVDLDKLRLFTNKPNFPENIMEDLKNTESLHTYLFGEKFFFLKARSSNEITQTKVGSLGVSIWYNGKPVDEFNLSFCVRPENGNACPDPSSEASAGGTAVFDAAVPDSSTLSKPDAALHILKFKDNKVYGIFSVNNEQSQENGLDKYKVWLISNDYGYFLSSLEVNQNIFVSYKNPDNWETGFKSNANDLDVILFPNNQPDAQEAKNKLIDFVSKAGIDKRKPFDPNPKTIFIRMITDSDNDPVQFPLGRFNYGNNKQWYLGYHFLIETSLPSQNYEISNSCIKKVIPVMLPKSLTEGEAIFNKITPSWFAHKQSIEGDEKYTLIINDHAFPIYTDFKEFSDWMSNNNSEEDSVYLAITSHHDKGSLYFDSDSQKIVPNNLNHVFKRPSIFLLNGCSTNDKAANGILHKLNTLGFDAGIITDSPISTSTAGEYLQCFYDELKEASGGQMSVKDAYWKTQKCFYPQVLLDNESFSQRVLGYSLTGNGEIKICP
jgi:hypothetical protein